MDAPGVGGDSDRLVLESPDHVEMAVELAGLGSRFVAAAVDQCVVFALVLAADLVMAVIAYAMGSGGGLEAFGSVAMAVMIGVSAIVMFGYHIVCEMRMNGQSVGKRLVGLRVVKDNGQPIHFFDSALRNFIRIGEMVLGFYFLGALSIVLTAQRKRLGDLAAGTIVVRVVEGAVPGQFAVDVDRLPLSPETRRLVRAGIGTVTQEEYEFIGDLLARAGQIPGQMATQLAVQAAWPLMQRMGIAIDESQALSPTIYFTFLQAVAALYAQKSAGV
jgi:uncharacterized RDD family membrane protein YckC